MEAPRRTFRGSAALRAGAWALGALLAVMAAAQAALWGGLLWLRSADGEAWLGENLSRLAAESGYTLGISGIGGLMPGRVDIRSLRLADREGPLLEAEKISLHVGFLSLLSGSVSLSGGIDSVNLHRLPASAGGGGGSFALPGGYFHALHINGLDIGRLSLDPAVAGARYAAAVRLSSSVEIRGPDAFLAVSAAAPEENGLLPEKIDARAVFSPGRGLLAVRKIAVASKTYGFTGAGTAATDGALDFSIHGDAALPQARAAADLRVTGTVDKPAFAATGAVSLPGAADLGDIRFTLASDGTPAGHAALETSWRGGDAALGADFAYADRALRFRNVRASGPGVSLRGGAEAVFSAQGGLQSAALSLGRAALGDAALGRLEARLSPAPDKAAYVLSVDAQGAYRKPFSLKGTLEIAGNSRETAALRKIDLTLRPARGEVTAAGSLSRQGADVALAAKNLPLGALPLDVPGMLETLSVTGKAHVGGPLSAPAVEAALDFSLPVPRKNMPGVALRLDAACADGQATLDIGARGRGIRTLRVHAVSPLDFSLLPFRIGAKSAGLRADVSADLQLRPAAAAFLPAGAALAGNLRAAVSASGAWGADMRGNVSLADGRFALAQGGLSLRDIDLRAAVGGGTLDIRSLRARDRGKGVFSAHGTVGFGKKNMPADLAVRADGLNPFRAGGLISGVFTGDLSLKGDSRGYAASGKMTGERVDVALPERFNSAIPTLNIVRKSEKGKPAPGLLESVALDVKLAAGNKVFVRGWGLDAEFGGALDIGGTLAAPLYTGQLDARRGRYEEFGRTFELQRAALRFEGAVPPSPWLDVLAITRTADIEAQVTLAGNIAKPDIKLSSVPALPQDEVLSHLLFGKDMTKISPFQAVQLANTLRRFSGKGGGFSPLSAFRKATGLDELEVGKNEKGETTVGAGKYIGDKVYLEAGAGSGENSGAAKVRIDITPHIKAESKIGQDNKTGGGIFWQWDY